MLTASDSAIALWATQHRDDPYAFQAVLDELDRRLDSLLFQYATDRDRIETLETYPTLLTVDRPDPEPPPQTERNETQSTTAALWGAGRMVVAVWGRLGKAGS